MLACHWLITPYTTETWGWRRRKGGSTSLSSIYLPSPPPPNTGLRSAILFRNRGIIESFCLWFKLSFIGCWLVQPSDLWCWTCDHTDDYLRYRQCLGATYRYTYPQVRLTKELAGWLLGERGKKVARPAKEIEGRDEVGKGASNGPTQTATKNILGRHGSTTSESRPGTEPVSCSTYEPLRHSQPTTPFLSSSPSLGSVGVALAVCVRLTESSNDGGFS